MPSRPGRSSRLELEIREEEGRLSVSRGSRGAVVVISLWEWAFIPLLFGLESAVFASREGTGAEDGVGVFSCDGPG